MMKGTMSVFLGLTLSMVMSLFFSMAEVTRYLCMNKEAASNLTLSVQNVFGEYVRPLWKNYGILGLDMSYGQGYDGSDEVAESLKSYFGSNGRDDEMKGADLLALSLAEYDIYNTVLLTDSDGAPLIKEAAHQAKTDIPKDLVNSLLHISRETSSSGADTLDLDGVLEDTTKAMTESVEGSSKDATAIEGRKEAGALTIVRKNAKGSPPATVPGGTEGDLGEPDDGETLLDDVIHYKDMGILSQVVEDPGGISNLAFLTDERVSNRPLQEGTGYVDGVSATERGLFQYYLLSHFGSYCEDKGNEGLQYELEYILCGKDNDEKNLTGTVERLLALREAENIASIMADPVKMEQVRAMALGSAAVAANPAVFEIVKYGIICAWSYGESLLDVRLLLGGGKVSFVKTPAEWTSTLSNLAACFDVRMKAKPCEAGLDYQMYLYGLFTLEDQKKLAYRTMDLMEESLHHLAGYGETYMDHILVAADFEVRIEAVSLFLSFIPLFTPGISGYEYPKEESFSYL